MLSFTSRAVRQFVYLVAVMAALGAAPGRADVAIMDQIGTLASQLATNGARSQMHAPANANIDIIVIEDFSVNGTYTLTTVEAVFFGNAALGANGFITPATVTGWRVDVYTTPAAAAANLTGDVASAAFGPFGSPNVTIQNGYFNGNTLTCKVTLNLTSLNIALPAGTYWIGVMPICPLGANTKNTFLFNSNFAGFPSNFSFRQCNPGGGFGFPGNISSQSLNAAYRVRAERPPIIPPTVMGAATPGNALPGQSSLLTATVTPGTNGIASVVGDLSPIGGLPNQAFFDDGPGGGHGDAAIGDDIYSFTATVAPGTPHGPVTLNLTVTDNGNPSPPPLNGAGTISFSVGYCQAQILQGCAVAGHETITQVDIDTFSNASGCAPYADFTATPAALTAGAITVAIGTPAAGDLATAFIDWNVNGTFEPGDETNMLTPDAPTPTLFTGTIAPPPGTPNGDYRMRIRLGRNTDQPVIQPCGLFFYGEVEDYTVTVSGGAACNCPGDVLADNARNGRDIQGFAACVISGAGSCACADVNTDTTVNAADITAMVNLLIAGTACP